MTDPTPTRAEVAALVAHNKALIDRNVALRERAEAAEKADARWQRNSIETWQAMQAMRNSIDEHLPMPSMESDLLQGPESSIFCASVSEAVITALTSARRAEATAWNDAIEAAAETMANGDLMEAPDHEPWFINRWRSVRALRRAAPTEREA